MTGPIPRVCASAAILLSLVATVFLPSQAIAAEPSNACLTSDGTPIPHLTVSTRTEIGLAAKGIRFCRAGSGFLIRNASPYVWRIDGAVVLPVSAEDIIGSTVPAQRAITFFDIAGLADKSFSYIVPGQLGRMPGVSEIRLETDAVLTAAWHVQKFVETRIGAKTVDALRGLAEEGSDKRRAVVTCTSGASGLATAIRDARTKGTVPDFDELYSAAVDTGQCRAAWDVAADFWRHGINRLPGYGRINVTPSEVDAVAAGRVASKARPVIEEAIEIFLSKVKR